MQDGAVPPYGFEGFDGAAHKLVTASIGVLLPQSLIAAVRSYRAWTRAA